MILVPDHILSIYNTKQLLDDFCKINKLNYFIYSLKELEFCILEKKLTQNFLDILNKNTIEIFFVPVSVKIDQNLYELFYKKIQSFGTAATGVDHVDFEFLKQNSLIFFDAQGENKESVVEYTLCVLPNVINIERLLKKNLLIGIVGFGRIGSLLGSILKNLEIPFIAIDPYVFPESYKNNIKLLKDCDLITFHVPLTIYDNYPTYEMVNIDFLQNLKKNAILVNTSRGKIFSMESYFYAIKNFICAFDVYIKEPPEENFLKSPNLKIATPHTAGYNWISRFKSVYKVLEKFSKYYDYRFDLNIQNYYPSYYEIEIFNSITEETLSLKKDKNYFLIRNQYPIRADIKNQKYRVDWNPFYKLLFDYFQSN